jgi:hypothetical protein
VKKEEEVKFCFARDHMSFENAPISKGQSCGQFGTGMLTDSLGIMAGVAVSSVLVGLFDVKHYCQLQVRNIFSGRHIDHDHDPAFVACATHFEALPGAPGSHTLDILAKFIPKVLATAFPLRRFPQLKRSIPGRNTSLQCRRTD